MTAVWPVTAGTAEYSIPAPRPPFSVEFPPTRDKALGPEPTSWELLAQCREITPQLVEIARLTADTDDLIAGSREDVAEVERVLDRRIRPAIPTQRKAA